MVGMTTHAITSGRAEANDDKQQGYDKPFLFHTSDFKCGKSFLPCLERQEAVMFTKEFLITANDALTAIGSR
jgi:hypothetical protein